MSNRLRNTFGFFASLAYGYLPYRYPVHFLNDPDHQIYNGVTIFWCKNNINFVWLNLIRKNQIQINPVIRPRPLVSTEI